ncbi:MAG TPA: hypothetical protein DHV29_09720 [Bacteroidales bacterium]|nr:hypothetical protein [Bacteroidales bacterium]HCB62634.1 hypothetical protein [Bacteroidales bacterium]HCY23754.1 hypothetical protein [Bacteroidales bacterium]
MVRRYWQTESLLRSLWRFELYFLKKTTFREISNLLFAVALPVLHPEIGTVNLSEMKNCLSIDHKYSCSVEPYCPISAVILSTAHHTFVSLNCNLKYQSDYRPAYPANC